MATVSYLVYYDTLIQNATKVYSKLGHVFLLQIAIVLLQNAIVITNATILSYIVAIWDIYNVNTALTTDIRAES